MNPSQPSSRTSTDNLILDLALAAECTVRGPSGRGALSTGIGVVTGGAVRAAPAPCHPSARDGRRLGGIVLIDDPSRRTMAGALAAFQGEHSVDVPLMCAAAVLVMAPTLVVFLLLQRHFIKAVLAGAVKG